MTEVALRLIALVVVVFLVLLGLSHLGGIIQVDMNLAGIWLAAAGIVLTGVAILVAILALFGFREILTRATDAAERAAREVAGPTASRTAMSILRTRGLEITEDEELAVINALQEGEGDGGAVSN